MLWCGNNITQLCASNSDNVTYYSALIRSNGLLSMVVLLCDNSTDESLGIPSDSENQMQSCKNYTAGMSHPHGMFTKNVHCHVHH